MVISSRICASLRKFLILSLVLLQPVLLSAQAGGTEKRGELLLSFTGDLMAHSINYQMTDYAEIYRRVKSIFLEDDLSFTNAEFPMDPDKPMASFPNFNIHPVYLEAFIDAGLDVFSLANNHAADSGETSIIASHKAASDLVVRTETEKQRAIYFSGISANSIDITKTEPSDSSEAVENNYTITEINKNGWKIGFLAVTQKSNVSADPSLLYQIDYLKSEEYNPFLSWLSEITGNYDLFILSYHGGVEYNFIPTKRKQTFFRTLIEAGVDIVWGHHPHVLQEIEHVKLENREGIILYSLGNFLSGQGRIIDEVLPEEEWSYTGDSAIIQLRVVDSIGNENLNRANPEIRDIHPITTANYITPNREVVIYPLEKLVLHPLPSPWDDFYRERSRIMASYFRENIRTFNY